MNRDRFRTAFCWIRIRVTLLDTLCFVNMCIARLKRAGARAETRLRVSEKWTSPFKSAGESVQSNTGRLGVRISGETMERVRNTDKLRVGRCTMPCHG